MKTCFALVNRSSSDIPELDAIAIALSKQLNSEFSQEWGGVYSVRVVVNDVGLNEIPVYIEDDPPQDGIAGYHDRTSNGLPIVYVFRKYADSNVEGSRALSVTLSHELLETALDPFANWWADRDDGKQEALEACDRVEDTFYDLGVADGSTLQNVAVSNFLLRSAFDAWATGTTYDYLDVLSASTDVTPGGYVIFRTISADGQSVSTDGHFDVDRKHMLGRSYKRGVRW